MAPKPNIAVVGLKHGWKFVDALYKRSDMISGNLIAICSRTLLDHDPPKIPEPYLKDVKFYNDYTTMLDELRDTLDGVILALPNDMHIESTKEAADRNIAVLLEKPIANTVEEGKIIEKIVRESKIPFMVAHHRRFSAKMNSAKEIIESGRLGKIVGANVIWTAKKPDIYFETKWRITEKVGGPLLINAIHDVDDLRYTLGEIDMVHAIVTNNIRGHQVEDATVATFRFTSGAIATYFMSDGVPSNMFYEATAQEDPFFQPSDADCYYFFGEKGTLAFPSMNIISYDPKHGDSWINPFKKENRPIPRINPIDEETKHFCKMIRGEAESRVTAEDATITLRVIDAMKESSAAGKPIYL